METDSGARAASLVVNASQKLLLLGLNYDGFVSKERNLRGTMEAAVLPVWKGVHLFLAIPQKCVLVQ